MHTRRIHGEGTYVHYVTFSCFKRRKLLTPDVCKRIVNGTLGSQLNRQNGICLGFVVMLDHVHAMIWFPDEHQISLCLNSWKELTSKQIASVYSRQFPNYGSKLETRGCVWQDRYYDFNIHSDEKMHEKPEYMHNNPVRAGLVKDICAALEFGAMVASRKISGNFVIVAAVSENGLGSGAYKTPFAGHLHVYGCRALKQDRAVRVWLLAPVAPIPN